jgi:hypothetical protein
MHEFPLEAVGGEHPMPSKEDVAKIRKDLWHICAEVPKSWNLCIPFGAFKFRPRAASDPIFRPEDFEGSRKGTDYREGAAPVQGGLDLLGRYRFKDSLVTIYIDSCRKVEQWYDVSLDPLIHVVLVHELAHLMTHRGFGAKENLSPHFWEYTAQCATYAYLHRNNEKALKVFQKLSPYQPFIYQTWQSLEALRAASGSQFDALVKQVFHAFTNNPLDKPAEEVEDIDQIYTYDE